MRWTPRACSWRLIVFVGGYATSDKEGLPQILTLLLRTRKMVATGPGPGLFPASLFCMMKTVIMSKGARVRHTKAWAMMLWAGCLTRSPNHHLCIESNEESFLGILLSQLSPCTMKEQISWSMWATLTKEWLCTLRVKSWCVRCSHPAWSLWQWGGSMVWVSIPLIPLRYSPKHLFLALLHASGFLSF